MPFATNGAVQIFYETFGDPSDPTLVLVNGLGSQCINYRSEWCERFVAKGYQVVRMDNRDVGLSTHFSDVAPDVAGVVAAVTNGEPATCRTASRTWRPTSSPSSTRSESTGRT